MKVKTSEVLNFTPVTVTITLETQEEANMLHNLMKRNVTIPEMIYTNGPQCKIMGDLMGEISQVIYKHTRF